MKLYRITVADSFGEQFIVTLQASSAVEAIRHIETDRGWVIRSIVSV